MTMHEPNPAGFEHLDPIQLGGGLTEAQRDAIARAIVERGPSLIRQGHIKRMGGPVLAGAALAAAAAAAVLFVRTPDETVPLTEVAAVPGVQAPACLLDLPASPVEQNANGKHLLQVGSRLRAVGSADSDLAVVATDRCNTRLSLARGAVTLHAADLRGGTLTLDTPNGQVHVTGTLFRVAIAASATTVSVAEGTVVMRRVAAPAETVRAGEALTVSPKGVFHGQLSRDEEQALKAAFDAPSAPDTNVESTSRAQKVKASRNAKAKSHDARATQSKNAAAMLAEAEGLWRKGERDAARTAFRKAAEDVATGEAAWVRLARLELAQGSASNALTALTARKKRNGKGVLDAEALWLEVQALLKLGRRADAVRPANTLLREYPNTPQAEAARRLEGGATLR